MYFEPDWQQLKNLIALKAFDLAFLLSRTKGSILKLQMKRKWKRKEEYSELNKVYVFYLNIEYFKGRIIKREYVSYFSYDFFCLFHTLFNSASLLFSFASALFEQADLKMVVSRKSIFWHAQGRQTICKTR